MSRQTSAMLSAHASMTGEGQALVPADAFVHDDKGGVRVLVLGRGRRSLALARDKADGGADDS
jgi:hypothetical protein